MMLPYMLVFCAAAVPALVHWRGRTLLAWWILGISLALFVGLRHEVGGDWQGYLVITDRLSHAPLAQVFAQEPAFRLLTWISAKTGFGVYGVNLVGAVIFFFGLLSFCAKLPNRWLALASAIPFLVIVAVMSANRQGMAIGIVLYVMSRWRSLGLIGRSLWILCAGLFHVSAMLLLVLTVTDLPISRGKKAVLALLLTAVGVWLINQSEASWVRYTTIYVEQSHSAYARGAVFHLLLNLVPAGFMLLYSKRWSSLVENWHLTWQLCLLGFVLLVLSPFMTVAVSRMSLYLFPVSITFFAWLPQLVRPGPGRSLVQLVCVTVLGSILLVWLALSNTAFTYFPYQNALLLERHQLVLPR
jgi:hypothetical protein